MKSTPRKISDAEVIAGFFREALFHSRPVQICAAGRVIDGKLAQVIEESSRGHEAQRSLKLVFSENLQASELGVAVPSEIRCAFPHFIASWAADFRPDSQSSATLPVPNVLLLENHRVSKRIRVAREHERSGPVLVFGNGRYTEGTLRLENHSGEGCGGILSVMSSFEICVGTRIQGLLRSVHGNYRVDGAIAQVQLLNAGGPSGGENLLKVGIANASVKPVPENSERRKSARVTTEFAVSVISPLSPHHGIELFVVSASPSGFLARLRDPSDAVLLSQALCVRFKDDSMLAEVVSQDEAGFRFQFVDGSAEDRLKWLGRLSRSRPGISSGTGVGTDIIDLFCESGAFSSKFIAEQSPRIKDILAGLTADELNSSWVHRWIERAQDGEIRGHSSAIRISDQLWHLGDIAGMRQAERRISRDLIPSFFRTFRDFCLSLQPCPRLVISWTDGHPYWSDFEKHLRTVSSHEAFSIRAEYVRILRGESLDAADWSFRKIEPHDFDGIKEILGDCQDEAHRAFLTSLDFSIESFGSPVLGGILRTRGLSFQRAYVLAERRNERFLVVLSSFPAGVCPQQSIEVPWVFPLGSSVERPAMSPGLTAGIRAVGLRDGFRFPGILFARSTRRSATGEATKDMLWTIGHPKILSFFDEREE